MAVKVLVEPQLTLVTEEGNTEPSPWTTTDILFFLISNTAHIVVSFVITNVFGLSYDSKLPLPFTHRTNKLQGSLVYASIL